MSVFTWSVYVSFFNTGVSMALDQSDRMVPLSRVWLNRAVKAGAKTLVNSFSNRLVVDQGLIPYGVAVLRES